MTPRRAILLVLVLAAAATVARADVQVTATVESDRVAQSDGIVLQIEVQGVAMGVEAPDLPRIDGVDVAGPSQQTSIQIVNGRMTRSATFVYQLIPRRTGKIRIPPATVRVGGRTFQTRPIDVTVVPDGSAPAAQPRPAPLDQEPPPPEETPGGKGDTFIQLVVDPRTAYVGQKIIASYYLLTRAELADGGIEKQPSFPGFWSETLQSPNNLTWTEVASNGVRFRKALVRRYALFALAPGDLKLDPFVLKVARRVAQRTGDPFQDMFGMMGGRTQVGSISSGEKTVHVRALPEQGKPADYQGAVGHFEVAVQSDSTTVKSGEALTYRVDVTGDGNVKSLKAPTLALPPQVKAYPPKETEEVLPLPDDYKVKKEFAYILVPETQGGEPATVTIPPAAIDYFDPTEGVYKTARSAALSIAVQKGEPGRAAASPLLSKEQVILQGQDIRYIQPNTGHLVREGGDPLAHRWAVALLLVYPVGIALVYAGARILERRRADVAGTRVRRAGGQARRRLKEAERLMGAGQGKEFFAEVQRAIVQYVADKTDANAAGLTRADVEARLADRGADAELSRAVGEAMDACDLYRFGQAAPTAEEMRRFYERAADVLTRLERSRALR